jgi:hypothetical protein
MGTPILCAVTDTRLVCSNIFSQFEQKDMSRRE